MLLFSYRFGVAISCWLLAGWATWVLMKVNEDNSSRSDWEKMLPSNSRNEQRNLVIHVIQELGSCQVLCMTFPVYQVTRWFKSADRPLWSWCWSHLIIRMLKETVMHLGVLCGLQHERIQTVYHQGSLFKHVTDIQIQQTLRSNL